MSSAEIFTQSAKRLSRLSFIFWCRTSNNYIFVFRHVLISYNAAKRMQTCKNTKRNLQKGTVGYVRSTKT